MKTLAIILALVAVGCAAPVETPDQASAPLTDPDAATYQVTAGPSFKAATTCAPNDSRLQGWCSGENVTGSAPWVQAPASEYGWSCEGAAVTAHVLCLRAGRIAPPLETEERAPAWLAE